MTWQNSVAGIIFKNCAPCHRPGEAGGFSLLSYRDAVKKARLIRFVTQSGYMPPWPADPGYSHFINERVLSEKEKEKLRNWVENGCPRGDSLHEPQPPEFFKGSFFRKPDIVIRSPRPVRVEGKGADEFLILKFPYELSHDTIADLIEFVPHQRKLIHHVNGHLLSYDAGRTFNYFEGESQSRDTKENLDELYASMNIPYTDGLTPVYPALTPNTVYYLPGYSPPRYPSQIGGYRLKKNGLFLLNNIHYGPSNQTVWDSSVINVFFRKEPLQRPVAESQLGTFGVSSIEPEFVIPPNEVKRFHTHAKLGTDISLLSVNPHMHLIGKSFLAYALPPSGDTIHLIRINKWDFRWQYYYTFKHPIKLPAGSEIHAFGVFDNTASNPNNPFHPPRVITQGNGVESMKTTEEMFQLIFTYVPYKAGDETIDLE